MATTSRDSESDRFYEKQVVEKDGVKGRLCRDCRQWVPLNEMPKHFQDEHAR